MGPGHFARNRHVYVFVAIASSAYIVAASMSFARSGFPRMGTVVAAATLDIVVFVPLAYYLLVVRRGRAKVATVVPVTVASFVGANLVIPGAHRSTLDVIQLLVIPFEVGLLSYIAVRSIRSVRALRAADGVVDPVEQFRNVMSCALGRSRISDVASTELGILYYALCAWRTKPHIPAGMSGHTMHRRSGHAGIVLAITVLIFIEAVPVHLLVGVWSSLAAWIVTIASGYGVLMIVADYRATVLRPVLIDRRNLVLRAGLRWSAVVPLEIVDQIASKPTTHGSSVDVSLTGSATHWILLSESIVVTGLYGIRRQVDAVGVHPDDPAQFIRSVNEALAESRHPFSPRAL